MSNITIKHNTAPNLKKPKFTVDGILESKLNNYELTSLMNKHNFTLFLGKAGQGKSTLIIAFLQTPCLFKKVYHSIILFCPPNSRASIKDDFWAENLPEDQIYDELTVEALQDAYDVAQMNAEEGYKTLIILDDVQKYLKENDIQKLLLHMVNNRRHAQLSLWMACQTYISIPRQVRQGLTTLFIFKVSKIEMSNIFTEAIELPSDKFQNIINMAYKNKHEFIYIDTNSRRIFLGWDEIIMD
jgi:hypothetical protein